MDFDCIFDTIINIYYEWYQVLKYNSVFCEWKWCGRKCQDKLCQPNLQHYYKTYINAFEI